MAYLLNKNNIRTPAGAVCQSVIIQRNKWIAQLHWLFDSSIIFLEKKFSGRRVWSLLPLDFCKKKFLHWTRWFSGQNISIFNRRTFLLIVFNVRGTNNSASHIQIRTDKIKASLKDAPNAKYYYPPKVMVPLPTCFYNPSGDSMRWLDVTPKAIVYLFILHQLH